VLRLLRLVLAAFVFPPRLVRAISSEARSEQRRSIWRRSLDYAGLLDPRSARGINAAVCFALYLGGLAGAIYFLKLAFEAPWDFAPYMARHMVKNLTLIPLCMVSVASAVFSPVAFGFLLTLGFYFMRFVGSVLRSEFALLGRVDQGATVLGRMREGGGKKE
jgi:hypothetical protein